MENDAVDLQIWEMQEMLMRIDPITYGNIMGYESGDIIVAIDGQDRKEFREALDFYKLDNDIDPNKTSLDDLSIELKEHIALLDKVESLRADVREKTLTGAEMQYEQLDPSRIDPQIRDMQLLLIKSDPLKYSEILSYETEGGVVRVDGQGGPRTREALRTFAAENNLKADPAEVVAFLRDVQKLETPKIIAPALEGIPAFDENMAEIDGSLLPPLDGEDVPPIDFTQPIEARPEDTPIEVEIVDTKPSEAIEPEVPPMPAPIVPEMPPPIPAAPPVAEVAPVEEKPEPEIVEKAEPKPEIKAEPVPEPKTEPEIENSRKAIVGEGRKTMPYNETVKVIQESLLALDKEKYSKILTYQDDDGKKIAVDGLEGHRTRAAITQFAKENNLDPDKLTAAELLHNIEQKTKPRLANLEETATRYFMAGQQTPSGDLKNQFAGVSRDPSVPEPPRPEFEEKLVNHPTLQPTS
jgi:peptidoglycan hydrolase-like protein with peptidoglycan-binding domain